MKRFSPLHLARTSARHPWLMLGAWLVVVAAAVIAASGLRLDDRGGSPDAESERALAILEDRLNGAEPPGETVVFVSDGATVDSAAYRAAVEAFVAQARQLPGVMKVTSFIDAPDGGLVSRDRTKTLVLVDLEGDAIDAEKTAEPLFALIDATQGTAGLEVLTAGDGSIARDLNHAFEKDLQRAELFGIPAALIVLVIVFGAVVAAGVPVLLAAIGIIVAVGATALISHVFNIDNLTMNMITMIGLAVGIDYTLFILERFREERRHGVAKLAAIEVAANTASRAVLFSGITVLIALASLLIVPSREFNGMAIGAILVVFAAVAIALTLLPAALSLLDHRLEWLSLPGRKGKRAAEPNRGFFAKSTKVVMQHPVISLVGSVTLLVAAAAPVAQMELGQTGLGEFPDGLASIHAYNVIDREFSAGQLTPTLIVIDGRVDQTAVAAAIEKLDALLAADGRFSPLQDLRINDARDAGVVSTIIDAESNTAAARAIIGTLRRDYIPEAFAGVPGVDVLVGGMAAETTDYVDTMNQYLPIVIAFVLALSFVLLTMVFRSLVIPVKAIIMNLLSVGAAYGLLVLVFQEGIGASLFGFRQTDTINAFLPVFLFAVLFGLSMDYHVFLLSRIQERYLHTGDNRASVAHGLRSTAHIITGAAAIMMVVFGGFAAGDMLPLQQTGFGLAVAVLLDATIVRTVLVPASMELLGSRNWWLPSWLEWMPRISVEGPSTTPVPAPAAVPVLDGDFGYAPAGGGQ